MTVLRDFAIILIAIEVFVLALAPVILLGALVYGAGWLRRRENLPYWLKVAQAYVALGQGYVQLAMAAIIRPIVEINRVMATVGGWFAGSAKAGGDEQ